MDFIFLSGILAALIIGISKGGLKGIGILSVTLMALTYGAKSSTGIILPLLITGDILAVIYFKKHTRWKYLVHFIPWMLAGILLATFLGKDLPEDIFKKWMGSIILLSVLFMWYSEKKALKITSKNRAFAGTFGFASGFTTMIGNLAGPTSNLYFLATRMPKNEIIGSSAWAFFIVNNFKVPLHMFSWGTINRETLLINAVLFPFVIAGFFIGVKIVGRFSEEFFRKFLLIVTALGAFLIFVK